MVAYTNKNNNYKKFIDYLYVDQFDKVFNKVK